MIQKNDPFEDDDRIDDDDFFVLFNNKQQKAERDDRSNKARHKRKVTRHAKEERIYGE